MSRISRIVCAFALATLVTTAAHARIEAVKGKKYGITKKHGPWMIMVASFHTPPVDRRGGDGLKPQQAADQLVYELRRKGIPAYAFSQKAQIDAVSTTDRVGRNRRSFNRLHGGYVVLAGNYKSSNDRLATRTLEWVKDFRPTFLTEVEAEAVKDKLFKLKSGGVFRATPGQRGPLSGAHLTANPLLSREELVKRRRDPLLVRLNSGSQLSLLNNQGKYTVVVATFIGRSKSTTNPSELDKLQNGFLGKNRAAKSMGSLPLGAHLDKAAQDAWDLARALRNRKVEAYVWHDRYKSMVTVGSFSQPNDKRIRHVGTIYGAKVKRHPQTGREILTTEVLTIPENPRPGEPVRALLFDPSPRVMEVPKLN